MPTNMLPLAIQSWCFRHFKALPDFFRELKAAGVSATELCGIHAELTKPETHADTINAFKAAGIEIVCIGVERFTGDIAVDRTRFEFAKAAGIKHISFTFNPEVLFEGKLKNIETLADEYDLKLSIHNHGGYDWLGNIPILKYVFSKTSPRIGLHLDTAWALDAGHDPIKMATEFGPRLYGVHIKDFTFDRARKPADVILGTGNLDLPKFMSTLKQVGFTGPTVIEYEGDEANPVPALKECVNLINGLK